MDSLRTALPERLSKVRVSASLTGWRSVLVSQDTIGFNLAALELLRLEIEQHKDVQLFMEAHEKAKKKKKKQNDKLEQTYVMTLTT